MRLAKSLGETHDSSVKTNTRCVHGPISRPDRSMTSMWALHATGAATATWGWYGAGPPCVVVVDPERRASEDPKRRHHHTVVGGGRTGRAHDRSSPGRHRALMRPCRRRRAVAGVQANLAIPTVMHPYTPHTLLEVSVRRNRRVVPAPSSCHVETPLHTCSDHLWTRRALWAANTSTAHTGPGG